MYSALCTPLRLAQLRHAEGVRLHLAQNKLGSKAAFAEHLRNARVHTLNLSTCGLGAEGVETVAAALLGNDTLRTLNLGGNVAPGFMGATKKVASAADAIAALLQPDSGVQLEALRVAGGEDFYFKDSCVPIVNALAENTTLKEIVLTGNQAGPDLATALGSALRTNRTLSSVMWDYNQIKSSGYRNFLEGLKTNKTLTGMPAPMTDVRREEGKSKKHAAEVRKSRKGEKDRVVGGGMPRLFLSALYSRAPAACCRCLRRSILAKGAGLVGRN